jgi:Transcriptional regulators
MENEFKATAADLTILENIESEPDTTQASLAEMMGVAVGTINWHLKRLIDKGYVKVKRAERKKLRYIITPEGIALRARLLVDFIQSSMELYRLVRGRSQHAISEIKSRGHKAARIEGRECGGDPETDLHGAGHRDQPQSSRSNFESDRFENFH